jgi:hypothetical protein
MSDEDLTNVAKGSNFEWSKMRETILKTKYPNLWEKYKDE